MNILRIGMSLCRKDFAQEPKLPGAEWQALEGGECALKGCTDKAAYKLYPFGRYVYRK